MEPTDVREFDPEKRRIQKKMKTTPRIVLLFIFASPENLKGGKEDQEAVAHREDEREICRTRMPPKGDKPDPPLIEYRDGRGDDERYEGQDTEPFDQGYAKDEEKGDIGYHDSTSKKLKVT
jgi:hypothetical protein